jgi:hypothetical protein
MITTTDKGSIYVPQQNVQEPSKNKSDSDEEDEDVTKGPSINYVYLKSKCKQLDLKLEQNNNIDTYLSKLKQRNDNP